MEQLVSVCATNKQTVLSVVKSLLDAGGIEYFVTNENLNLVYGAADGLTLMDIRVREEDAADAREILKDITGHARE